MAKSLKPNNSYSTPGILRAIVFPFFQTDGTPALTIARTSDTITTLTVDSVPFIVETESGTGVAPETLNNPNPGVKNLKQSYGGKFARISDDTQKTMKELNLGRFGVVAEVKRGEYWLIGEDQGLTMEKNDGGFSADFAGNDFLLSGLQTIHAGKVSQVLFDALLATASEAAVAS